VSSFVSRQAYLDGELCSVFPDGTTSFSLIQAASDAGNTAGLVFFIFDLLHPDSYDVGARPAPIAGAQLHSPSACQRGVSHAYGNAHDSVLDQQQERCQRRSISTNSGYYVQ
jgi:hypothetical protein